MLIQTENSFYFLAGGYLGKVSPEGEPMELPMKLHKLLTLKVGDQMIVSLKNGKIFKTSKVQQVTFP